MAKNKVIVLIDKSGYTNMHVERKLPWMHSILKDQNLPSILRIGNFECPKPVCHASRKVSW